MNWRRGVLMVATLVASWLGMQAVHELGHVLGGLLSGGTVQRVVLHPLTLSRTDVEPNPHPLLVVWLGPMFGVVAPLLIWLVARGLQLRGVYVLRFFVGFCLIANGLYIGVGSWERIGDAGEMLSHGSPVWVLWLFGAISVPLGFGLWHGQGSHFGWGRNAEPIDALVMWSTVVCAALLIAVGSGLS